MTTPPDPWLAAQPYEQFMGRWSRRMARVFVEWLAASSGGHWLDLGCGTGALSAALLNLAAPRSVVGVDPSAAYLAFAREWLPDPRMAFHLGDALHLPPLEHPLDAAVSGLVLNFIPGPLEALQSLVSALRPGGLLAVYVWDFADRMEFLRYFWDSVVALDPSLIAIAEGNRFPLCQPDALRDLFARAGLSDIETTGLEIDTRFASFDDYWQPFLLGQGPAGGHVAALSAAGRAALQDHLRAALPIQPDGSIPLVARVWAVRGQRPA